MTINSEKMRADFEEWAKAHFDITERSLRRRDCGEYIGDYCNSCIQDIWYGWQASRKRIVTEESAKEFLEETLWTFIDTSAMFPSVKTDPRTWEHVLVYAPVGNDTKRLNWLGQNDAHTYRFESTGTWRVSNVFGPIAQANTLRGAIDAAMSTTGDAAIGEKGKEEA